MRTTLLPALLFVTGSLLATSASAGEIRHNLPVELGIPDNLLSTGSFSIPSFPTSLGTLKAVQVSMKFVQTGELRMENASPFPVSGIYQAIDEFQFKRSDGLSLVTVPMHEGGPASLAAFDGVLDYNGPSSKSVSTDASGLRQAAAAPDQGWTDKSGSDRVNFDANLFAVHNALGGTLVRSRWNGTFEANITIIYIY